MTESNSPPVAVKIFLRALMLHCRDGIIEDIKADLGEGPPGQEPSPEKIALHKWFLQLSKENQEHINYLVSEVVDSTIFSVLALLDGVAGGYPVDNTISDFALYLQTYTNLQSQKINDSNMAVRINKPTTFDHLHDIFTDAIKNRKLLD